MMMTVEVGVCNKSKKYTAIDQGNRDPGNSRLLNYIPIPPFGSFLPSL